MSLLNKSAVKKAVLARWKLKRPGHEMTRVDPDVLLWLEGTLINTIDKFIQTHPSVGKTIKPN